MVAHGNAMANNGSIVGAGCDFSIPVKVDHAVGVVPNRAQPRCLEQDLASIINEIGVKTFNSGFEKCFAPSAFGLGHSENTS